MMFWVSAANAIVRLVQVVQVRVMRSRSMNVRCLQGPVLVFAKRYLSPRNVLRMDDVQRHAIVSLGKRPLIVNIIGAWLVLRHVALSPQ
jgi:hypothetical protein